MQTITDYYLKLMSTLGGGYWLGTYGQIATETLWYQKSHQDGLEDWYVRHADAKARWMGKQVYDCIGLDKYARWVQPDGSIPYDAETDLNQEQLFAKAKADNMEWGTIDTLPIPEVRGLCVWFEGHIGYTCGNGKAIESRGGAYGVVITEISERPWTHWFYNPFIDYKEVGMDNLKIGSTGKFVTIWQKFLKVHGWTLNITGIFGLTEAKLTAAYNKLKGIISAEVDLASALFATEELMTTVQIRDSQIKKLTDELNTTKAENVALKAEVDRLNKQISDKDILVDEKAKSIVALANGIINA